MINKFLVLIILSTQIFVGCKKDNSNPLVNYQHLGANNSREISNLEFQIESTTSDLNGGFLIVGSDDGERIVLVKLNPSLEISWQTELDSSENKYVTDVNMNQNGDYTITANSGNTSIQSYDNFIYRTNENGIELWRKKVGGDLVDEINSILETETQEQIWVGTKTIDDTFLGRMYLQKINVAGDSIFERYLESPQNGILFDIQTQNSQNFTVLGQTNFENQIPELFVFNLNSELELIWKNNFSDVRENYLSSKIISTQDDGFYILGNSRLGNLLLIKINESGTEQWRKEYGGENTEVVCSITENENGEVFILGTTQSYGGGLSDWLIIKIASNGEEIWNRTWGGQNYDTPAGLELLDEKIILFGTSNNKPVLIELDFDGKLLN